MKTREARKFTLEECANGYLLDVAAQRQDDPPMTNERFVFDSLDAALKKISAELGDKPLRAVK